MKIIATLIVTSLILTGCFFTQPKQVANSSKLSTYFADVSYLADDKLEGRETGTAGEILAASYISVRMKKIGLSPKGVNGSFIQEFKRKKKAHPHDNVGIGEEITGRNIIGFIDNKKRKTIVIGAHYDHLGYGAEGSLSDASNEIHNGADDNASGVAAMLSLAKKLKGTHLSTNVLFIAFSGEEKGLWGSNYFVKNATINKEDIKYMINMDMVGRLDSLKRLAIYGIGTSPTFPPILTSSNIYGFANKYDSSGVGPSDHTSFYLEDIPVLHFFTGQHKDYHRPSDDTEFINFEGLAMVTDYIESIILKLDSVVDIPFTKTKSVNNKGRNFKVTLGVIPDYLYDGVGMRLDGIKEDRPAKLAGIQKGDIVIKMGEFEVKTMMNYMECLGKFEVGQTIDVTVLRNSTELIKKVTF